MFKETDLKSFDSIYGVILWCCIKQRCITDQYFDDDVSSAAHKYNAYGVELDYLTFRDNIYHTIRRYVSSHKRIDDSFLLLIHQFLLIPNTFTFKFDGSDEVYNLTTDTLKLFKPENNI